MQKDNGSSPFAELVGHIKAGFHYELRISINMPRFTILGTRASPSLNGPAIPRSQMKRIGIAVDVDVTPTLHLHLHRCHTLRG